jgi:spoIIIJ-associated protein
MADITMEPGESSAETSAQEQQPAAQTVDLGDLNPDQRRVFDLVQGMCDASGMDMRAVVRSAQRPYLHIELMGEDVQTTFARAGQGLDALQLLFNIVMPRNLESEVRLMLDAEGYRARRAEALRVRAVDLAREVKERNQEAELEPLPAHERRIIHAALSDDPDVSTYSEGDEPHRRIVISPVPK